MVNKAIEILDTFILDSSFLLFNPTDIAHACLSLSANKLDSKAEINECIMKIKPLIRTTKLCDKENLSIITKNVKSFP